MKTAADYVNDLRLVQDSGYAGWTSARDIFAAAMAEARAEAIEECAKVVESSSCPHPCAARQIRALSPTPKTVEGG